MARLNKGEIKRIVEELEYCAHHMNYYDEKHEQNIAEGKREDAAAMQRLYMMYSRRMQGIEFTLRVLGYDFELTGDNVFVAVIKKHGEEA